jgi:hypothetical protein
MRRAPLPPWLALPVAACVHTQPPANPVALEVGEVLHVEFPGPPEQDSTSAVLEGTPVAVATAKYFERGDTPVLLKARIVRLGDAATFVDRDSAPLCEEVRAQLAQIATSLDARPALLGALPGCAFQFELPRLSGRRPRSLLRQGAHVTLRVAVGHSFVALLMTSYVRGRSPEGDASRAIDRFVGSTRVADDEGSGRAPRSGAHGETSAEIIEDVASALVGDLLGPR